MFACIISQCDADNGWGGDGFACGRDDDMDGHVDVKLRCQNVTDPSCLGDNCPGYPNSGQEDADGDLTGDVCDSDDDNDRVKDENVSNKTQVRYSPTCHDAARIRDIS